MQEGKTGDFSADTVLIILDFLYTQGEDAVQWLTNEGIDTRLLQHTAPRLSAELLTTVWLTLLKSSGNKNLGLNAGISINTVKGNILSLLATNSPTIGTALDNICHYHSLMSGDRPQPYMRKQLNNAFFCMQSTLPDPEITRQTIECMYAAIITILRQMTHKEISPSRIEFAHAKPTNTETHDAFFNCPIRFNCTENTMLFSNEVLSYTAPYANEELLNAMEQHAKKMLSQLRENNSWESKVKRTLIVSAQRTAYLQPVLRAWWVC